MTSSQPESLTLKKGRTLATVVIIALFAIGAIQALTGAKGFVTAQVDDVHLGVCGTYGETTFIKLTDITDVRLVDSFDFGSCIEGETTGNTISGLYSCQAYAQYTVHAYTDVSSCIVVTHQDGILVFNCDTQKLTENIYNELMQTV